MKAEALYLLLKSDLKLVEKEIKRVLEESALESSKHLIEYVLEAKGKMIRPILVLLSAYAEHGTANKAAYHQTLIKVAAAIEIIHMASLLHDDVIDEAKERRGKASLNACYGDAIAVTMGVLLYSASLALIAETKHTAVLTELSKSVREMCEGELLQYKIRTTFVYNEKDYYDVIYAKTGTLFRAACFAGALSASASNESLTAFDSFSKHAGLAFQLSDDYLDLFGDKNDLNKELGQDYLQGQLTLPMIYALESLNEKDQALIITQIENKDISGLQYLKEVIERTNVQDKIFSTIESHLQKAQEALSAFPNTNYVKGLRFITEFIGNRVSPKKSNKLLTF